MKVAPAVADVAFYLPWIGPRLVQDSSVPHGGAETQVYMLACELARRGVRVCLVTLAVEGELAISSSPAPQIVMRSPSHGDQRYVGKLLEAATVLATVSTVRARVWVQRSAGTDTGLVAIAARLHRRRFVYSSSSVVDFDAKVLQPNRRDRALFHAGIQLASRIVVQTPEQVALCRARFGRDPALISSAVEAAPLRTAVPDAFLWIGNLAEYKRPLDFVELARAVPEAQFRMVTATRTSSDPVRGKIESRAASLPNLEILGHMPRPELLELMETAVAIVNTAEFEGMPNIFLEGWARGVPALALYCDPDGVVSRERLGAYASGSFQLFVEQCRALWRARCDQAQIAAQCRAYVMRKHSLRATADRWIELLDPRSSRP